MNRRHLFAPLFYGIVEGKAANTPTALAGIDTGAHAHGVRIAVDGNEMLVAHVEAFIVLAHQHQINVVIAATGDDGLTRTQIGVELELLAQLHINRSVATADWRFQRTLEGQPGAANTVQTGLG